MKMERYSDEKREWILEQLKSGELKNKPILYYKELGEPSHATALDYLINKYNWSKPAQTPVSTQVVSEGSNSLQKSIFDNISKELYNKFENFTSKSKYCKLIKI